MGVRSLTSFGRTVRLHRSKTGMMLKEMADELGVSSAWLSNVESGRKPIPCELPNQIADILYLSKEEREDLKAEASRSQPNYRLEEIKPDRREVAEALARRFNNLSQDQVDGIRNILSRRMK